MATTQLGKFLRKIRIDHDERMYDMAKRIGVSSAFLSSVENGRKKPSDDLIKKIVSEYQLTLEQQKELAYAKNESLQQIDLSGFSPAKQEATLMFARKFDDLSNEDIEAIRSILTGGNDQGD